MSQTAILMDGDPIELLQGWLVPKMQKSPRHVYVSSELAGRLESLLPEGWWVNRQGPITMADSEPEPDLAIIRGDFRGYRNHHPSPDDAALVIEIAHSTLEIDRGLKQQVYASAGIPEYWIINLPDEWIEVYTQPVGRPVQVGIPHEVETIEGYPLSRVGKIVSRYQHRQDYVLGQAVPVSLQQKVIDEISVADIFP